VADARSLAWLGASFYISGGLVSLAMALWSYSIEHRSLVGLIGGGAVLAGIAVGRWAEHIPFGVRVGMNFGGTGLVLAAVILAGPGSAGQALVWLFCFVPIDSFFFFPWRWSLPMLGWGSAATAVCAFGSHTITGAEFLTMQVVAAMVSFGVGWLIRSAAKAEWDAETGMLSHTGFDRELNMVVAEAMRARTALSVASVAFDRGDDGRPADGILGPDCLRTVRRWLAEAPEHAGWGRMRDYELGLIWRGPGVVEYLQQCLAQAGDGVQIVVGVTDLAPGVTASALYANAVAGRLYSEQTRTTISRYGLMAERVSELEAAINTGQLEVHYQPIVALADGRVTGGEALTRWRHPSRGLLLPDAFIPLAEQAGLIGQLGKFVLLQACRDAATWSGSSAKVTVNVAGAQLTEPGFSHVVRTALAASGLPADRLVLEVTESTINGDSGTAHQVLHELRGLGVRVAIDDFGTGYSTLGRLSSMPVDIIKFDRVFVLNLQASARGAALLRGLLGLAAQLTLRSVVEGIETAEDADLIRALGGDEAQGWLWGKAVPAPEFVLAPSATAARIPA